VVVPVGQCRELAERWYEGRDLRDWVRDPPDRVREIFREVGLVGSFWEV
jgi:hypothetical protein